MFVFHIKYIFSQWKLVSGMSEEVLFGKGTTRDNKQRHTIPKSICKSDSKGQINYVHVKSGLFDGATQTHTQKLRTP